MNHLYMSAHTQGPWEARGFMVMGGKNFGDTIGHLGSTTSLPPSRSHETEANAKLTAAGPAMYDLLCYLDMKGGLGLNIHERIHGILEDLVPNRLKGLPDYQPPAPDTTPLRTGSITDDKLRDPQVEALEQVLEDDNTVPLSAFPQGKRIGDVEVTHGGMSLRDYFAANCPLSFPEAWIIWSGRTWEQAKPMPDNHEFIKWYTAQRYAYADFMLKAREVKP